MISAVIAAMLQAAAPEAAATTLQEVASSSPIWLRSPGPNDYTRGYPSTAREQFLSGDADLVCRVGSDGGLVDCKADHAAPADVGFAEAALAMKTLFRLPTTPAAGVPPPGATIRVRLAFRLPADVTSRPIPVTHPAVQGVAIYLDCRYKAAHLDNCQGAAASQAATDVAFKLAQEMSLPPMPRPLGRIGLRFEFAGVAPADGNGPNLITQPLWLGRPSGADMARVYPGNAMRHEIDGSATLSCKVTKAGTLATCEIIAESPAGEGFGEATLRLAPLFKVRPMSADGSLVEGGTIRIPIRFVLPRR